jgi:hypothetical protein
LDVTIQAQILELMKSLTSEFGPSVGNHPCVAINRKTAPDRPA